jgi:DNA-binding XRE family transcriptional regulator
MMRAMTPSSPKLRAELRQWIDSGQARQWREAAGLTQAEAAAEVGVHYSTFGIWEAKPAEGAARRYPRGLGAVAYHQHLVAWRKAATDTPPSQP